MNFFTDCKDFHRFSKNFNDFLQVRRRRAHRHQRVDCHYYVFSVFVIRRHESPDHTPELESTHGSTSHATAHLRCPVYSSTMLHSRPLLLLTPLYSFLVASRCDSAIARAAFRWSISSFILSSSSCMRSGHVVMLWPYCLQWLHGIGNVVGLTLTRNIPLL